jgi:hypothetical protein
VQPSQYASGITPPSSIESNPTNAPYCMAVTIQNNNTGVNANNIQIIQTGMTLSYNVGANSYSGTLYDPTAATVTISGSTQNVGNVMIYDPTNCATTQGSNVVTLGLGGGSCTFYLQLTGESFPVGVYGMTLTYNYTNGNQNYAVSTNINQRVNLYAGGNSGLYLDSSGQWQAGPTFPTSNVSVSSLARDLYGNIYVVGNGYSIYQYNGSTVNQLGTALSDLVNGITTDNYGNLYAATSNGIYEYNFESALWVEFNGTQGLNFNGINSYQYATSNSSGGGNILYATTANSVYQCNVSGPSLPSCTWNQVTTTGTPTSFNDDALAVDVYGNLYTGNESSLNVFASNQWNNSTINPTITGQVMGIFWASFSPNAYLYFGEINGANGESSAYGCNLANLTSPSCTPLLSTAGNSLTGNINAVSVDLGNNFYAVGGNLNSTDFIESGESGPFAGAYITESGITATGVWTPITGTINLGLQTMVISSMMTAY